MKIGILSVATQSYSTRRLCEATLKHGHTPLVMNTLKCHLHIASQNPSIYYEQNPVPPLDVIIPRIGASITFYGTTVLRQFEVMGVHTLNSSAAINRARDKIHALQLLSQYNIPLPTSGFANQLSDFHALLPKLGENQYLIKPIISAQGKGIQLAEDIFTAQSNIAEIHARKKKFFIQKFIQTDEISDIRCFVIGKNVIASIKRQAKAGEFRANLHCGGIASVVELTPKEQALALKVVDILGLSIAGVDILRTPDGPVVLEVNASPGLEGIETVTGIDIAGKIIEYIDITFEQSINNPAA